MYRQILLSCTKGPADAPLVNILSGAFSAKYGLSLKELSNLYDYQKGLKNKILNLWLFRKLAKMLGDFKIKNNPKN